MNATLDQLLVVVVLLVSIGYVTLALGPRNWRRFLAQGFLKGLARAPRILRRAGFMARLERVGAASACGGCNTCADPKTPAKNNRETKVPLASIGRRR